MPQQPINTSSPLNNLFTQRVLAAVDAMDAMMREQASTGGWDMGEKEKEGGKGEENGDRGIAMKRLLLCGFSRFLIEVLKHPSPPLTLTLSIVYPRSGKEEFRWEALRRQVCEERKSNLLTPLYTIIEPINNLLTPTTGVKCEERGGCSHLEDRLKQLRRQTETT